MAEGFVFDAFSHFSIERIGKLGHHEADQVVGVDLLPNTLLLQLLIDLLK